MSNITPTDTVNGINHRLSELSVPDLTASCENSSKNQRSTNTGKVFLLMMIAIKIQIFYSFGGKRHQISHGDNFKKFYSLTLFDIISITFSHTGLGIGVWGCNWWAVCMHTLLKFTFKFTHKSLMILF